MKKIIKNTVISAMTLVMALNLAGCGSSTEIQAADPLNIAFVIGIADDETKFDDGIAEFSTLPASPGTDYAFISVEGKPTTIGEAGTIPDLSDRGYTDVMMDHVRAGVKADLTARLASYEPLSDEIDIAAATELAVRSLNANAAEGRRNILVYYCSGKSTTGLINMLETPVYKLDVESSVARVSQEMEANMSGIDVIFYCCGDFGGNQPKLSADEKMQLKSFYEQLFNALGAKSVTFKDDLPSSECYHFAATPVSCIAVEGTASQLKDLVVLEPEIFEGADAAVLEAPIVIPETQVRYKSDSAEFLDPAAAAEAIKPVADFLAKHSELNILLYGTCAGDADSEHTLQLGKARAESVKKTLVAAGIDERRITAVTVKVADDPYYQYGLGTGPEASVNRKCVMVDITIDLARQILANAC